MESIHQESIQTLKGYFWKECIDKFFLHINFFQSGKCFLCNKFFFVSIFFSVSSFFCKELLSKKKFYTKKRLIQKKILDTEKNFLIQKKKKTIIKQVNYCMEKTKNGIMEFFKTDVLRKEFEQFQK